MEFVKSMLDKLESPESIFAILMLVGAFLLGVLFHWVFNTKAKKYLAQYEAEKKRATELENRNKDLELETKSSLADMTRISLLERESAAKYETVKKEKEQTVTKFVALQSAEAGLKAALQDAEERYAIAKNNYQQQEEKLQKVSTDYEASLAQSDAMTARIGELELENETLKINEEQAKKEREARIYALEADFNGVKAEEETAKNNLVATTKELENLQNQLGALQGEFAILLEDKAAADKKLAESSSRLNNQNQTIKALLVKQNQYILRLDELSSEVASVESLLEKANKEKEKRAEKEFESLNASAESEEEKVEIASLHAAQLTAQQEADRYKAMLVRLQADLARVEDEKEKEQESFLLELSEMKANHEELLALENQKLLASALALEELEAQIALGSDDRVVSELNFATASENSQDIAAAEMSDWEKQIEDLEEQIVYLEAHANEVENENVAIEERYRELMAMDNQRFATTKDKIMNLEAKIEKLEEQIVYLEAHTNEVENENVAMANNFRELLALENKKFVAAKDETMQLQAQIIALKSSGSTAENESENTTLITGNEIVTPAKVVDVPLEIAKDESNKIKTTVPEVVVAQKKNSDLSMEEARAAIQNLLGNKITFARVEDKNNLKAIKGIGAFIERKLNDLGIYRYEQISQFDKDIIEKITIAIEFFEGRIERDKWVKQAKDLM